MRARSSCMSRCQCQLVRRGDWWCRRRVKLNPFVLVDTYTVSLVRILPTAE